MVVSEIMGLTMRGAGEYVGWVGNKVRNRPESCNLGAVKHG